MAGSCLQQRREHGGAGGVRDVHPWRWPLLSQTRRLQRHIRDSGRRSMSRAGQRHRWRHEDLRPGGRGLHQRVESGRHQAGRRLDSQQWLERARYDLEWAEEVHRIRDLLRGAGNEPRTNWRSPPASRPLSSPPPMAKKVLTLIKLQIPAGAANPAPPVGPALGQHGVNIMEFCKAFNAQTQQDTGTIIPVEITVYEDRSFDFITKTPPAAVLIKEFAGIQKGSGEPHTEKVGKITADQVRQIAERKMPDLNANDIDAASRIIAGTARSMGVEVEGMET